VKRSGDAFAYSAKTTGPDTQDHFVWGYTVQKGPYRVEVKVEDARDKTLFSGFYPPRLEEWTARGWEVTAQSGAREDFGVWRCAACKWLYKEQAQGVPFADLPDDWKCPVCKVGKDSFEQVA
jgi:rubredoxin